MKQFHLPKLLCRQAPDLSAKLPFEHSTNRIKNTPLHSQQIHCGILKSVPAANSYKVNMYPSMKASNQIWRN